jgi:hypothetical protein
LKVRRVQPGNDSWASRKKSSQAKEYLVNAFLRKLTLEYSLPIQTHKVSEVRVLENRAPTSESSKRRKMKKENHLYQILEPSFLFISLFRRKFRGNSDKNQRIQRKFRGNSDLFRGNLDII